MKEPFGLIGVGLVGSALAEHLLARGAAVIGYDIDPERLRLLERLGGRAASGPREIGERAECVILSLMNTGIVREAVEGRDGVLSGTPVTRYLLDTTTGDPDETEALAGRLAARGVAFLDAAISGSSQQIRDRQAVFMVGGAREAFEACRPALAMLGDRIHYLGPSGSGSRAKLASNLVLGLNRLALAEGLVFAEKLGLDLAAFLDLLKRTPAYSAIMDAKGAKMIQGDFAPQSKIRQHCKDVAMILDKARARGQALPLSEVHLDVLARCIAAGEGDMDTAAVIREIRRRVISTGPASL